jgi:hypothetical protein
MDDMDEMDGQGAREGTTEIPRQARDDGFEGDKAGVDVMKGFLYICGGEVGGIAAGDEVLPQTRAALPRRRRRLVGLGFADSAAIIHSI